MVHELFVSEPKIFLMSSYRNLWPGESLRALKVRVTIERANDRPPEFLAVLVGLYFPNPLR